MGGQRGALVSWNTIPDSNQDEEVGMGGQHGVHISVPTE